MYTKPGIEELRYELKRSKPSKFEYIFSVIILIYFLWLWANAVIYSIYGVASWLTIFFAIIYILPFYLTPYTAFKKYLKYKNKLYQYRLAKLKE